VTNIDHLAGAAPVLTVTLNPALDISLSVDQLVPDRKLRALARFVDHVIVA